MQFLRANGTNNSGIHFKGEKHTDRFLHNRADVQAEINKQLVIRVVQIDLAAAWVYALLQNIFPHVVYCKMRKIHFYVNV